MILSNVEQVFRLGGLQEISPRIGNIEVFRSKQDERMDQTSGNEVVQTCFDDQYTCLDNNVEYILRDESDPTKVPIYSTLDGESEQQDYIKVTLKPC